jgi:hypothetical protein
MPPLIAKWAEAFRISGFGAFRAFAPAATALFSIISDFGRSRRPHCATRALLLGR